MSNPKVAQKGPFVMTMQPGKYYWCACGKSNSQPFCDSSHKGSEFSPIMEEITIEKKIAWCGCKHSGIKPFCDGTHRNI